MNEQDRILIMITPGELSEAIARGVAKALKDIQPQDPDKIISLTQAQSLLRCGYVRLQGLIRRGQIRRSPTGKGIMLSSVKSFLLKSGE